jgi:hypothetical protein
MSHRSERLPEGVPAAFSWADHPRTLPIGPLRTFRAFTAWGQLYQCSGTALTARDTVDLRDLQTWVMLRNSARWRRIQFSSDLAGAAFSEDYRGPTVSGRYAPSPTSTSVKLVPGHNFHFWPSSGRASLDASDVAAVTVAVEARLEPTAKPAAASCLVLSVGGDLWKSLTAAAGPSESGDVGIGRFKRVEQHWRLFTMTTASARVLYDDPIPPVAPSGDDF